MKILVIMHLKGALLFSRMLFQRLGAMEKIAHFIE